MADEKLKPGDVVKLKSGGPKMTVNELVGNALECVWFLNGVFAKTNLSPDALERTVKD